MGGRRAISIVARDDNSRAPAGGYHAARAVLLSSGALSSSGGLPAADSGRHPSRQSGRVRVRDVWLLDAGGRCRPPSTTRSAPAWLPTGVAPVRYVLQWGLFDVPDVVTVHCPQVDDDDHRRLVQEKDIDIAHCPRCNAKLAMGTAPVHMFLEAGMRVGLGTDSPASNNAMDMFDEMRIGLLVQRSILGEEKWMTARQIMKMATLDGADCCDWMAASVRWSPARRRISSQSTCPSRTWCPRTIPTAPWSTRPTKKTC